MVRATVPMLAAALGLAACAAPPPAPTQDLSWVPQARQVATGVPPRLLAVLQQEIAQGGPEGAIAACREKAPAMAREASQHSGWQIRRVSLRNRNPRAVPDAWERAVLEDFDRLAATGAPPAQLERAEVVSEGGQRLQRYMRALPTIELCTQCHGATQALSPAVKARLTQLYPQDRATGYRVGDIRGAMTLQRALP